ncbi:sensor histidine kinase [Jatrophihabitans sp. YIM 134969]
MATLADVLAARTDLADDAAAHLQRLVQEWQLLSDLSFADLLLWVPLRGEDPEAPATFVCAAQCRPTTAPTAYQDDRVGNLDQSPGLRTALTEARILRPPSDDWLEGVPVRREAVPVRFGDAVVAVMGRDSNQTTVRHPSQLELAYLQSAADLTAMVADGTFPGPARSDDFGAGPRAGDGLLRLDSDGTILYASPNALSGFRRLGVTGNLINARIEDTLSQASAGDPLQVADLARAVATALSGVEPASHEVDIRGATVRFRVLPLRPRGEPLGALVLLQDITELRRLDRQIMSKDATIREIHHRVKNNLQTVAALLRLQARRTAAPEARLALEESMRRVSSIAMVHETLSTSIDETVAFGEIVDRLLQMLAEIAPGDAHITMRRTGEFGPLPAEVATSLVLVLTELVQNALEHAYPGGTSGTVEVTARRAEGQLEVSVRDDGVGLRDGFTLEGTDRLGLQIVRTLVTAELSGSVALQPRDDDGRGAEAVVRLPVPAAGLDAVV